MKGNHNILSIIKPEKSPIFYGYIIAFAGTVGVLASLPGQTMGVSTFTDPVKDALGLNRDQFSNAYMIGTILSSMILGQAGKWFDKYGARWLSFFATIGLIISLLLCASSVIISDFFQTIFNTSAKVIPFLIMVFAFFLLRFTGQGVLTMSSRNMIMKWFDNYRGRVNAVRSIVVSLGFSASPLWISLLIDANGWQNAWLMLALGLVFVSIFILQFFRDMPENHGLLPDGVKAISKSDKKETTKQKQYTLKEALKTRAFWMYSLTIAFYSFFVTGLTFHVVSIFENAGYDKSKAVSIFVPISVISVVLSLVGNILTDFIKLNLFLYLMLIGGLIAAIGLVYLSSPIGIYLLIAGVGLLGGMFAVLNAITWPRFYGRTHLGAITGKLMSLLVFASALAPSLYSLSITYLGNYKNIGIVAIGYIIIIAILSFRIKYPNEVKA